MLSDVLKSSAIFDAHDPHTVSDYVNRHIGNHHISLLGDSGQKASLWYKDFSDVGLSRITYGSEVRVSSPELQEIYHLQIVTAGQCEWRLEDKDILLRAGELLLLNPNDQVDLRYSKDCEKVIVKIPKRVMQSAVAENHLSLPREGVRFDHVARKSAEYDRLIHLLELIFMEAEAPESAFQTQVPYNSLLAVKLLDSFSSNISLLDEPKSLDCFGVIDRYIAEHIKDDISVNDLAELSKVSQRTLYNLFARHKSVTPMHYIKQQKLQHVHKLLRGGEESCRNVTEVALDFGFMHLGRFSNEYRKMFGELPSQTLKKRLS